MKNDINENKALSQASVSSCVLMINMFWCGFCKATKSFRYIPKEHRGKYESKYSYGWECSCCKNRM